MKRFVAVVILLISLMALSAEVRLLNAPWGWLYVDGVPFFDSPNFSWRIDSKVVDGIKEFDVDPGLHQILLLRYDMVPLKTDITVSGSEKEIRLILKPLKGWVKKTAVMVAQSDEKDILAESEEYENMVADELVRTLREYNVPAYLIRLYQKSVYDPHIGMVIINDVLSHPWRYQYYIIHYVLRIMATVFDEYDYLIVGNFDTIYDKLSEEVSGSLELIVYDLKDLEIVQKPDPYSDYEIYPGYHRRYFITEGDIPFYTLYWTVGGKDMDLEKIVKEDIHGILPYLLDMLAVDSYKKGINWREIELRNPDITNWDEIHYLIERAAHASM